MIWTLAGVVVNQRERVFCTDAGDTIRVDGKIADVVDVTIQLVERLRTETAVHLDFAPLPITLIGVQCRPIPAWYLVIARRVIEADSDTAACGQAFIDLYLAARPVD